MGITAEYLRDVLDYDSLTGHFKWKRKTCCKVVAGKYAGFVSGNGYKVISIGGVKYKDMAAAAYLAKARELFGEFATQRDR